jgi:hypothetical protein
MDPLQRELETLIQRVPWRILARYIAEQVEAKGAVLSEEDQERLEEQLRNGDLSNVSFEFSGPDSADMSIELTAEAEQEVRERFDHFLEQKLPELISSLSDSLADSLLKELRVRWREEARRQAIEITGFRRRLERQWREPLQLLRMLLTIARDAGGAFSETTVVAAPKLKEVLTRLHARACQVTDEIIVLLAAGFADGAMARWRTLHEIATVALFLQQHGEDLAVRYIAHEAMEARRAAKDYMNCCARLGYEPLSDEELDEIELEAQTALSTFGPGFDNQYGWAAAHIGKKAPRIDDIERAVSIDHLRAHYRMASHNVHANPKGVFFRLGLLHEVDLLLAGPSNAGLTDPGHSAAISLTQVSSVLLTADSSLDNIITMKVMSALVEEIGEAFEVADDHLQELAQRERE